MGMHHSQTIALIVLAAGCMAFTSSARAATGDTPTEAPQNLKVPRLAEAFQMMLVTQNQCINYAYDKNGNRTSLTSSALKSTHPVWGTDSYLCFTWSAN